MAGSSAQSDQIGTDTTPAPPKATKQEKLRYLDFVHVAAIQALMCLSRFYDIAKENSGPLKSGVQTVEGTVKAVVGPLFEKFHDAPLEILKFVDRKVGDAVEVVERHVPSLVKGASNQAYAAAQKAPQVARSISDEVQLAGIVGTTSELVKTAYVKAQPVAKALYARFEPVPEQCAVLTWRSLNKLPVFPQVVQIVVPTAAYWTEKYNDAVCYSAGKGYAVAGYLPLVPTKRIAKVFGENEKAAATSQ